MLLGWLTENYRLLLMEFPSNYYVAFDLFRKSEYKNRLQVNLKHVSVGDLWFESLMLVWLAKEKQVNFIFRWKNNFKNQTSSVIKTKLRFRMLVRVAYPCNLRSSRMIMRWYYWYH